MNRELTLTIITEISSLIEAEIYSISQLSKQLNPPVKQGKHFPSVQQALDSAWAVHPSAPEADPGTAEPQQPSREFRLCAEPAKLSLRSVEPRASAALPARSLRHRNSQTWEAEQHNRG